MLRNLGIVQACFDVPRFRANAGRRVGGRSLLEWVIRRVTEATRLDGVIVLANGSLSDKEISHLIPADVPLVVGEGSDPLARFCSTFESYPAEAVVRVRGDSMFVDPSLIDRLVTTAESTEGCDYVGYCSQDGRPAILSPACVYAEWFRISALRRANRLARDEADRARVTSYMHSHPDKFNIRLLPAPRAIDREDVRLTVDIEEDWDHVLAIFEALGPERLDWQRIADLLDHQPALRDRMAELNRAYAQV